MGPRPWCQWWVTTLSMSWTQYLFSYYLTHASGLWDKLALGKRILNDAMYDHTLISASHLELGHTLKESHTLPNNESSLLYCWLVMSFVVESHYDDVIMGAIASQITSLTIVYSTDCSGAYQSKHQSSASLAFVRGIHRGPVNSPHKWPVTRNMSPSDDVNMSYSCFICGTSFKIFRMYSFIRCDLVICI